MAYISISIHAPREGCDAAGSPVSYRSRLFQSTHPVRGATNALIHPRATVAISIHAPREGCDLTVGSAILPGDLFQSTHPVRGATLVLVRQPVRRGISIHAPREGCDSGLMVSDGRSPISIHAPREGCDQLWQWRPLWTCPFQSTHPVRGATPACVHQRGGAGYFNPRTP